MTADIKELRRRRNRGKSTQKKLAELVDGKNVGSLSGEDVAHHIWSFECKNLAKSVVKKFMDQAEKNCPKKRRPAVLVKLKGHATESGYIIVRFKDFKELMLEP